MSDLLDVADAVAAQARGDEQLEAYVGRSTDTQVRVYQGEVEQLAVADSLGVGVRIVHEGRQGFAYCGTFDAEALAETVSEARDNAAFGEPDEAAGLAEPDGVEPADLDLWRPGLADVATDRKVALALELERAVLAADPRIAGVESCDYGDSLGETAVVTTTGIRRSVACDRLRAGGVLAGGRRATRRRPASASRWGGISTSSTSRPPQATPPNGRCACWAPPSRLRGGSRSCSIPG